MSIDEVRLAAARAVLHKAVDRGDLRVAMGMVGDSSGILMTHASGHSDALADAPASPDAIFAIASMTKLVTTIAALQLVDQAKLELDVPVDAYLPELAALSVLEGFDDDGAPLFVDAHRAPTARELITHTSGFVYSIWNEDALTLESKGLSSGVGSGAKMLNAPLAFQPGTAWEYGIGIDWLGVLIEKISGKRLEVYFQDHIFTPLGMTDTTFELPQAKLDRALVMMMRVNDELEPSSVMQPEATDPGSMEFYGGGGGLFSTLKDYGLLLAMLLNDGRHAGMTLLRKETVDSMFENHIGPLEITPVDAQIDLLSNNLDMGFGAPAKWGLGFLLHTQGTANGRSPGSASWAGLFNSYFWIDREKGLFGVFATQALPFMDGRSVAALTAFERAVYGLGD